LFFIDRKQAKQRASGVPKYIPSKDDLDALERSGVQPSESDDDRGFTESHYGNVTLEGSVDHRTDPAVDPSGYMKKQHGVKKGKKSRQKATGNNRSSIPADVAPAPPSANDVSNVRGNALSVTYTSGRVNCEPSYVEGAVTGQNSSGNRHYANVKSDKKKKRKVQKGGSSLNSMTNNKSEPSGSGHDNKALYKNVNPQGNYANQSSLDGVSDSHYENLNANNKHPYYNGAAMHATPNKVEEVVYDDQL